MKDKNIYTVDYFIEKFEKIPESKWTSGRFRNTTGIFIKRHSYCALGFCLDESTLDEVDAREKKGECSWNFSGFHEFDALNEIFGIDEKDQRIAALINNGLHLGYQQPTPKQRILAALRDIKQMQAPQEPKQEKEYIYCFSEKHESIEPLLEKEIIYS